MSPATAQQQSDFRLIVLLAVAVLICIQHIPAKSEKQKNHTIMPISWHDATDKEEQGLYFDASGTSAEDIPSGLAPIFFQLIAINSASEATLTIIPGIGNSLAAKIVNYRQLKGSMHNADDLLLINGIGKKKAAIIAQYVSFRL